MVSVYTLWHQKYIKQIRSQQGAWSYMTSICTIKLCGSSIYKPLQIIFKSCLNQGIFPAEWTEANVLSVHKKGDYQCIKDYRLVSLLPVFSKIFERLIYNTMSKSFLDNSLFSSNQPGFKPGDSCINQLITITHDIFKGFDDRLEKRGVFHDISKAFDKVWHEGLFCKLCCNGILVTCLGKWLMFIMELY